MGGAGRGRKAPTQEHTRTRTHPPPPLPFQPADFEHETDFHALLNQNALSCSRHWYKTWYAAYVRAAGRLPGEYTGVIAPSYDAAFDEKVHAWRLANGKN